MALLYGTTYTRDQLTRYVGSLSQICGVQLGQLDDGAERGVRTANFRTGTGFVFTVLADRGLDIAYSAFRGASLDWRSPTTCVAPSFFEPEGLGWLRGFYGGLLNTCGLTYYGKPTIDEGVPLGLHGRASFISGTKFAYGDLWIGDEYEMWVSGEIREAAVHGENLVLHRRISTRLGESRLYIKDMVTNEGFRKTPHMMLYHINLGFPVVSPSSELLISSSEVRPRTEVAARGLGSEMLLQPPTKDYEEQVFYHILHPDQEGYVTMALVNRYFNKGEGLGVYLKYRLDQLPIMAEWKMMGEGTYVFGLNPGTNFADGRDKERAEGRLRFLTPGEVCQYELEIGVLDSIKEIDIFEAALSNQ
jgi:hypothetical protein